MTGEQKDTELIVNNKPLPPATNRKLSDDVIIEIIHALKDIFVEFISRKYQLSADK